MALIASNRRARLNDVIARAELAERVLRVRQLEVELEEMVAEQDHVETAVIREQVDA